MEIEREQKYSDTFSSPGCGRPAGPGLACRLLLLLTAGVTETTRNVEIRPNLFLVHYCAFFALFRVKVNRLEFCFMESLHNTASL